MATLIMAYAFDVEKETSTSEEEDEEEEDDGFSQSAYEMNKGLVPLADLFNAGTSIVRSDFSLICTSIVLIDLFLCMIPNKEAALTPKT